MSRSPQPHPKRFVYLLEPHPVARERLVAILNRNGGIEVIPITLDLADKAGFPAQSSVLVIDANALPFPVLPYLVTVRKLLRDAKILIVGNRIADDVVCALLSHGGSGYIVYEKIEDEIEQAVDAVFNGHVWAPPGILESYVSSSSSMASPKHQDDPALSPRERQVVGLIGGRLSNKEIASALGISERTVRFHLGNIFRKVGVHDRSSLSYRALTYALLDKKGMAGADQSVNVPVAEKAA